MSSREVNHDSHASGFTEGMQPPTWSSAMPKLSEPESDVADHHSEQDQPNEVFDTAKGKEERAHLKEIKNREKEKKKQDKYDERAYNQAEREMPAYERDRSKGHHGNSLTARHTAWRD